MARVLSKESVVILGGTDISGYCNSSSLTRVAGMEDVTVYGDDDHKFAPTLGNSTGQLSGFYDDGASGPRATILALYKTETTLVIRPEGTGANLPQDSMAVIVSNYQESAPFAGHRLWSVDFQVTGTINAADQT